MKVAHIFSSLISIGIVSLVHTNEVEKILINYDDSFSAVKVMEIQPLCTNGVMDGDETDKDCGGPLCPPCDGLHLCLEPRDCKFGFSCDSHQQRCIPTECFDGKSSGLETDIDCGGNICKPCKSGSSCKRSYDCESQMCIGKLCVDNVFVPCSSDSDCSSEDINMICDEILKQCLKRSAHEAAAKSFFTAIKSLGAFCERNEQCISGFCDRVILECSELTLDSEVVVDCEGKNLTNRECASVDYGYASCKQHMNDNFCDDGAFISDSGSSINFNCDEFNCDNGACGACRKKNGDIELPGIIFQNYNTVTENKVIQNWSESYALQFNGGVLELSGQNDVISDVMDLKYLASVRFSPLLDTSLEKGYKYEVLDSIDFLSLGRAEHLCPLRFGCRITKEPLDVQEDINGHTILGFYDFSTIDKFDITINGGSDSNLVLLEGFFLGGGSKVSKETPQTLAFTGRLRVGRTSVVAHGGLLDLSGASEILFEQGLVVLPGGTIILGGAVSVSTMEGGFIVNFGNVKILSHERNFNNADNAMHTFLDVPNFINFGSIHALSNSEITISEKTKLTVLPGGELVLGERSTIHCTSFSKCEIRNLGSIQILDTCSLGVKLFNQGHVILKKGVFEALFGSVSNGGQIEIGKDAEWIVNTGQTAYFKPNEKLRTSKAEFVSALIRSLPQRKKHSRLLHHYHQALIIGGSLVVKGDIHLASGAEATVLGWCSLNLASGVFRVDNNSHVFVLPTNDKDAHSTTDVTGDLIVSRYSTVHIFTPSSQFIALKSSILFLANSALNVIDTFTTRKQLSMTNPIGPVASLIHHGSVFTDSTTTVPEGQEIVFKSLLVSTGPIIVDGTLRLAGNSFIGNTLYIGRNGRLILEEGAYVLSASNIQNKRGGSCEVYKGATLLLGGDATFEGYFKNDGKVYIGVRSESILRTLKNDLAGSFSPLKASSPNCDPSQMITIEVQFEPPFARDLSVTAPIKLCSSDSMAELHMMVRRDLSSNTCLFTLHTIQGDLIHENDRKVNSHDGSSVKMIIGANEAAPHTALRMLAASHEPYISMKRGASVDFIGSVGGHGRFLVSDSSEVGLHGQNSRFEMPIDNQGNVLVGPDANVEFDDEFITMNNVTIQGNVTFNAQTVFGGDVHITNSGNVFVTSLANVTFDGNLFVDGSIISEEGSSISIFKDALISDDAVLDIDGDLEMGSGSVVTIDGSVIVSSLGSVSLIDSQVDVEGSFYIESEAFVSEASFISVGRGGLLQVESEIYTEESSQVYVDNGGTMRLNGKAHFALDVPNSRSLSENQEAKALVNRGNIVVSNMASLTFQGTKFTNHGEVKMLNGGKIACLSNGGSLDMSGSHEFSGELIVEGDCVVTISQRTIISGRVSVGPKAKVLIKDYVVISSQSKWFSTGSIIVLPEGMLTVHGEFNSKGQNTIHGRLIVDSPKSTPIKINDLHTTGSVVFLGIIHLSGTSLFNGPLEIRNGCTIILEEVSRASIKGNFEQSGHVVIMGQSVFACESQHCTSKEGSAISGAGTALIKHKAMWIIDGDINMDSNSFNTISLHISDNSTLKLGGAAMVNNNIVNKGIFEILENGNAIFGGDVKSSGTLKIDGALRLAGSSRSSFEGQFRGTGILIVGEGSFVEMNGNVELNGDIHVLSGGEVILSNGNSILHGVVKNDGTFIVEPQASLSVSSAIPNSKDQRFTNDGVFIVDGILSLDIQTQLGGTVKSRGTLTVLSHGKCTVTGSVFIQDGNFTVDQGELVVETEGKLSVSDNGHMSTTTGSTTRVSGSVMINKGCELVTKGLLSTSENSLITVEGKFIVGQAEINGSTEVYGEMVTIDEAHSSFTGVVIKEGGSLKRSKD